MLCITRPWQNVRPSAARQGWFKKNCLALDSIGQVESSHRENLLKISAGCVFTKEFKALPNHHDIMIIQAEDMEACDSGFDTCKSTHWGHQEGALVLSKCLLNTVSDLLNRWGRYSSNDLCSLVLRRLRDGYCLVHNFNLINSNFIHLMQSNYRAARNHLLGCLKGTWLLWWKVMALEQMPQLQNIFKSSWTDNMQPRMPISCSGQLP